MVGSRRKWSFYTRSSTKRSQKMSRQQSDREDVWWGLRLARLSMKPLKPRCIFAGLEGLTWNQTRYRRTYRSSREPSARKSSHLIRDSNADLSGAKPKRPRYELPIQQTLGPRRLIRDRFVAGHENCALRRHLFATTVFHRRLPSGTLLTNVECGRVTRTPASGELSNRCWRGLYRYTQWTNRHVC